MSIVITIVTTANRQRRFVQTDPALIEHILDSLKRAAQWFKQPTLVIVSSDSTEVFNPSSIARIEIATEQDLAPYLPSGWKADSMQAIAADAETLPGRVDDEVLAMRVEFFFEGGDTLPVWFENMEPGGITERKARTAHLFEQPVIPYRPQAGGIGLINPATLTRARFGVSVLYPPNTSWFANEA
jgi:hypothetical protein